MCYRVLHVDCERYHKSHVTQYFLEMILNATVCCLMLLHSLLERFGYLLPFCLFPRDNSSCVQKLLTLESM